MHRHASLNRIFRLVWSHVHQAWVAVAENARSGGKGSGRAARRLMLAAAALAAAQLAQAGPTGGQVTAGNGAIVQAGATTTVAQGSQNLSLLWQSFNTGAAETVNFVQPSASAIAVNRIADSNGTQFFGKLNANGQVWLINPNGVLFGAGSQINVGGLIASTLDVDDRALGNAARQFSGAGTGAIVNHGAITSADGGYVAFLGNRVDNQGSIAAPRGAVALGAGSDLTLSFAGNSLVKMQVNQGTLDNLAQNGGLIRADGGTVVLSAGARDAVLASVVNNTGIIEAKSVREVNGSIVLDGGAQSTVANSGTLDASGRNAGETGGSVKVLGQEVSLAAGGKIDVAGDLGGGTALVGGNFLGAGTERNAANTSVAAGSSIDADAVSSGTGGQVAVWSDGTTRFDGRISARGGAESGNGGAVETSGKVLKVGVAAGVDTLAPRGAAGDWLLDPQDITIGGFNPGDGDITGDQVTAALEHSSVTIKTGFTVSCVNVSCLSHTGAGDIILADGSLIGGAYNYFWGTSTSLTLSAYRNIDLRGTAVIDASFATGNITLRADNTGTGVGTVLLDGNSGIYGKGVGSVNLYYNPTSYAAPTNYASLRNNNGDLLIDSPRINSYMYINAVPTVASKIYDGSTAATVSDVTTRRALPSGITLSSAGATATFADKNVGTAKATTVTGVSIGGAGAGQYALNGLDAVTADIGKRNLSLSGISANNKTYNGSAAATLSGSASVTAVNADVVSVSGAGVGAFADKNAGNGKAVTVSGYTLAGADAANYTLVLPSGLTANITKANLAVTGIVAANKTYDATTVATLTGSAAVSAFGADVVSVGGSGVGGFADKNAGNGKAVTVTGYTLSGLDAANYNVIQPTGLSANIAKASLAVGGLSALDKTYDGTATATLAGSAGVTALGSDAVSVTGSGTGTFATKNAGAGKAVTVSGFTLAGVDAANYNIVQPAGLSANIAKANLALTGLSASNKTYDGSTAATLSGTAAVAAIGADVVSVSGSGAAAFADKNAGNGKAVTVSGYTLSGLDAANYNIVQPTGLSANIAKASLAVSGIGAANKTYDATSAATLTGSAAVTAFGADVVSVGGSGVGSFADKNAGNGKAVTVTGYTLSGLDAANYNIVQPTGVTANIAKASLAVGGLSALDKTYDGTATATLAGSAGVSALGSDVVGVTGSGAGSFADKNAGAAKAVTVSGYTLTGVDAANYNIVQPAGLSASIAKANLALTGLSASNKTYDGSTAATLTGSASVTAIGSDVVTLGGSGVGSFADKNAGSGKAVTVSGFNLSGLDAVNYTLVAPSSLTASIARANLAVTGIVAANKTYDATTTATLTGSASVAAIGGDVVAVAGTGAGSFADKNAAVNKTVTVTGYTLSGTDAANYNIIQPTGLSANIAKASLAVSGIGAASKTYDATTAATLTGSASVAALGSDVVSVTGSGAGSFADKNAGSGKAVGVTGFALSGVDAGNYNLVQPSGLTASIAKANLALTGLTASNKTYDGSTAATLTGSASVAAIASDVVTLGGSGVGSFADKNAGSGKAVVVSGYTLGGLDASNYTLVAPSSLTASIARAKLAVTGIVAANKTYDATSAATLTGSASVAAIGGDVVAVAGSGTASFADKNAGNGKAVTVTGYTLSGLDAANYNIIQPTGLSANIAKASLAVTGIGAANTTYDATTAATLTGSASVAALGSDVVSVTGSGAGSFADKNAGSGKAVSVTGFVLGGVDAGNYTLVQPAGLTANIAKANLALTGLTASNKTYDGSTAATLTGSASVAAIASDVVTLGGSGVGSFADKNAGSNKAVTVSGFNLSGLDAANYTLVAPSSLTASIAKANLAVTGIVAANKTYDATTAATLTGSASVAAIGGDVVAVAGSGAASFADKNAGNGKAVTVSGYSLSGLDAANYNIVQPTGLSANIAKASLAVTGIGAANKTYDATTAATLTGSASVAAIGSDVVSVTGSGAATFADKNAGSGKAVGVTGFALSGADAGNYNLVQPTGLTASIAKANLALTGLSASNKTYDGSTAATLTGSASVAAIGTDVVTLGGSGVGSFVDKNAGSDKAVTVSGFNLTGLDASNYTLVAPSNLTASIAKANLAVSGIGAANKTYDATTAATLTGSASVAAIGADIVTVTGSGAAAFADKNAGSGKAVSVTGFALGGVDAGNYNLVQPTGLTANIVKANLAVSGIVAAGKTYDATTAATLTGSASVTAIGGDVVSLAGTGVGSFADKNVGSAKPVAVTGYSLSGVDAGNYTLVQPAGLSAAIGKADLALTGVSALNKTYDGSTAAALGGSARVAALGNDVVSVAGSGSASFADKNAGAGKLVTVGGYSLGGADAGNYTLVLPAALRADIAKASLAVSGIAASDKTFDGSTAATVSTGAAVLGGKVAGDSISLASTGAFDDAAAGVAKTVRLTNTLSGADAGNYTLGGQSTALATITALAVTPPVNPPVSPPVSPPVTPPVVEPVTPVTPVTQPPQLAGIIAQVQSSVLPPQASAQAQSLNLSSSLVVTGGSDDASQPRLDQGDGESRGRARAGAIDTRPGSGAGAPTLQIQNGGVQLPPLAINTAE